MLLFPTKEEIYLPLLNQPVPGLWRRSPPELARRGIDYIDFSGPFTAQAKAGRSIYFELDPHPNRVGYALIAHTVSQYLQDHATALGLKLSASASLSSRQTH